MGVLELRSLHGDIRVFARGVVSNWVCALRNVGPSGPRPPFEAIERELQGLSV